MQQYGELLLDAGWTASTLRFPQGGNAANLASSPTAAGR